MLVSTSINFNSCFFATIFPRVVFPTAIIPNKTRFFFTVNLKILNLIFHNFVLIFESKYNLIIMQLRLQPKTNRSLIRNKFAIKIILFAFIFLLAIILLDKREIAAPNKLIKQEISNDKIITLK